MTARWKAPFRVAGNVLSKVYVEPIRTDRIRTAGWPAGLLIIAVLATVGYAAAVALAIGAPWLRHWLPMAGTSDTAGMPVLVPTVTAALLCLAAALGQTGALHAPVPLRILVLLASLAIMIELGATLDGVVQLLLTVGPWLVLVIMQVIRWRAGYRWWEYVVVVIMYAIALLGSAQGTSRGAAYGGGSSVDAIDLTMEEITIMAAPLAMLAGYAIAQWAFGLVLWTAEYGFQAARRTIPTPVLLIILVGLIIWRLIAEWHTFLALAFTLRLIIFPGIMIIGSIGCWLVVDRIADRRHPGDTGVEHLGDDVRMVALPAAVGLLASSIFDSLVVVPLRNFASVAPALHPAATTAAAVSDWLGGDAYGIGFSIALILWGGWLAWRGSRGRAEITATIGLAFLLTRIGQLAIGGGGFNPLLVTSAAALLIVLLVTRRLDRARIEGMIIVIGFALAISGRQFFADPVSSIIGGSITLFLGLVWQFLTSGGIANDDTRGWPRPSRVLMVLGFNLLAMLVVGYARVTDETGLTLDRLQDYGNNLLGGPLILGAAIAIALGLFRSTRPVAAAPDDSRTPVSVSAGRTDGGT
ncbi:hypothetical protein GCM10011575_35630 [Microlunatus endophyticus]|uniref:Uncharacterized protein n=1 Tax=Microlunatus endophyticus TaxID=1716077 RepID=A0A917SDE4_9ACTN|nr:hypothetical protein [Microlunatus endophyticus]GGL74261.1 hypothetical protein GCM10011575_35630 [Microlunatus endophyticus]